MKKLMIAAAIVCAAAMSQAAAIKWSGNNIKTDNKLSDNATGYLCYSFIQSSDAGSSEATRNKWWELTAAVDALTKEGGADLSNFKITGGKAYTQGTTNKGIVTLGTYEDAAWSDKTAAVQSYVIVFNSDDVATATEFLVLKDGDGNKVLSTTFADGSDTVNTQFKTQATNAGWTAISTSAVPEPTSGLLLLLGVAGLALRRRRA